MQMREFCAATAALIWALAAPLAAQEPRAPGVGPERMVDTYLERIARKDWEGRSRRIASIATPAEIGARQEWIRRKLLEKIGGFPERTPLRARITGSFERAGYRVEKLIFESQPRYSVTANVYVPLNARPPFPAVLGASGHDTLSKADPDYQRVWVSLARRGFLVLTYDPPAQGERSEDVDPKTGRARRIAEHIMVGAPCLLTGTNFARYEIWDGIRAIDYLWTRSDVDRTRLGVAGHSGGGTQTAYLAALDARISVAAPTCYITSWERLWAGPGPQDAEQTFAGFLRDGLDFGDFLLSFAPRPMLVLAAMRDVFPIAGTRATVAEERRIYSLAGAADRIDLFESDDEHSWSKPKREAVYRWMERWLHGRADDGVEAPVEPEPPENLYCTRTGQVATSLGGETTQSLNAARAERLLAARSALPIRSRAEMRPLILKALTARQVAVKDWRELAPEAAAGGAGSEVSSEARDGPCRVERISLETERGITVPAAVFAPAGERRRLPAVLYIDPAGKAATARCGGDIAALVAAGRIVMTPDLRGWGASSTPQYRLIYDGTWLTPFRALLVGRTMAGMQVFDLLRALDYLAARGDVDAAGISLIGKGNGGVIALFAAALDERVRKAAVEGAVPSYMSIVRAKENRDMVEIMLPGVLEDFDLPDVAAAIAGRTLWIVDPRTPAGLPLPAAECLREYAPAARRYAAAGRSAGFRVTQRQPGDPFWKTYAGWLRD